MCYNYSIRNLNVYTHKVGCHPVDVILRMFSKMSRFARHDNKISIDIFYINLFLFRLDKNILL